MSSYDGGIEAMESLGRTHAYLSVRYKYQLRLLHEDGRI